MNNELLMVHAPSATRYVCEFLLFANKGVKGKYLIWHRSLTNISASEASVTRSKIFTICFTCIPRYQRVKYSASSGHKVHISQSVKFIWTSALIDSLVLECRVSKL